MRDRDWDRFGAAVGIIAVVIFVAGVFLTGSPPKPTDTNDTIKAFMLDKRSGMLTQIWLSSLGLALLVWWAGAVRSVLRRAEGDTGHLANVYFGLAVLAPAIFTIGFLPQAAFVYKAGATASGELARFVFDLGGIALILGGFALGLAGLIYAVLVLSTGALARWTAWLAVLAVVGNIVGTFGLFLETGAFSVEGTFGFVPFGINMVWIVGVSVAMLQVLTPRGSRVA
jgi:hypothetical protein